jgi:lipoprotein-anchoring transpeptidase ErfK/SrfK
MGRGVRRDESKPEPTILWPGRVALASATVLAGLLSVGQPAAAQFYFNDYYNKPYKPAVKPKPVQKRPAAATRETISRSDAAQPKDAAEANTPAKPEDALVARPLSGPLVLTVSLRRQRVSVFDANGLVTEAPISSGTVGRATPTGVYSVLEKNRVHYSNLYDNAPMPNMQRITWSGVALHAGHLPGYPASHGCIRLPSGFSKRLFDVTKLGTRVIVSEETLRPQPVSHDALFAIHPEEQAVATHALLPQTETRVANASETGSLPAQLGRAIGIADAKAEQVQGPHSAIAALRDERRRELERLSAAIPAAESARDAAIFAAQEAGKQSEDAKEALKDARATAGRAAIAARQASQAAGAAEAKLKSFERALTRKTSFTPEEREAATRTEDQLEAAALDSEEAAAAAQAAGTAAATDVSKRETAWKEAEQRRVAAVAAVKTALAAVDSAREADAAAKRREAKRKAPIHVFISRKTQKIYARQGYEPILEAAVTIDDPQRPLGTHVFTALAPEPDNRAMRWSVVSIPTLAANKEQRPRDPVERKRFDAMMDRAAENALTLQTAGAALDRISMPQDVRLKIEDVMKTGSSLIVSDNGMSNETGQFTDFIVPVR